MRIIISRPLDSYGFSEEHRYLAEQLVLDKDEITIFPLLTGKPLTITDSEVSRGEAKLIYSCANFHVEFIPHVHDLSNILKRFKDLGWHRF